MRKATSIFALVIGMFLFAFGTGTASAQGVTYSRSSVSIGGSGFSLHIEESNFGSSFGFHVQSGRWGNHVGVHFDDRRVRRHHPQFHDRRQQTIIIQQPRYQQPRYQQPQSIQVQVVEMVQVQREIVIYDRFNRPCPTGRYEWVWVEKLVTRTAYWDHRQGIYVYTDANGQPCIWRGQRTAGWR